MSLLILEASYPLSKHDLLRGTDSSVDYLEAILWSSVQPSRIVFSQLINFNFDCRMCRVYFLAVGALDHPPKNISQAFNFQRYYSPVSV
jgi:hypothetical protein